MRPVITSMSGYQAKIMVTDLINRSADMVLQSGEHSSEEFLSLRYNQEGNVSSVETNTQNINAVQTELTQKVVDVLAEPTRENIYIPLGTLLGFQLLSGRGPDIEIKIVPVGSVKTVMKSEFTSAGVNQTLHKIVMEVDATALAIIPGYTTEVNIQTQYILAETLIVGTTPNSYTQILTQSESAIPYVYNNQE